MKQIAATTETGHKIDRFLVSKVNKKVEQHQNWGFTAVLLIQDFCLHCILPFSKSYPGIESTCPQSAGEESLLTRDTT